MQELLYVIGDATWQIFHSYRVLNTTGLAMDIIGLLGIMRYGIPTKFVKEDEKTRGVGWVNRIEYGFRNSYSWHCWIWFGLTIGGFLLQIVSNFV